VTIMRVLAVDPGYDRLGVAVVAHGPNRRDELLFSDCVKTSRDQPLELRLVTIGSQLETLLTQYAPDACALERLYFHSNKKTALSVAEAMGVVRYIAAKHKLSTYEYTPLQVKTAVTGDGRADKRQVMHMVGQLVPIKKPIRYDDEFDAIAVGLTCLAHERLR